MRNLDELLVAKCFRNKKMNRHFGVFADDDINSKEPQFSHFTGTFTKNRPIPKGKYNKLCLLDTEYAYKLAKEFENNGVKYDWLVQTKRAKILVFFTDKIDSENSRWITADRYKIALSLKPLQMDEKSFFFVYFQDTIRKMLSNKNLGQNILEEYKDKLKLQN